MKTKDDGLELDYWKDYRIIEAYQYIAIESERKKVIRQIEECRTADEAKAQGPSCWYPGKQRINMEPLWAELKADLEKENQ